MAASKLASKVAIVTGGASGLGLATVKALAAAGARVAILDLPSSKGQAAAEALGSNAMFVAADVTSEAEVKAAIQATVSKFGGLNFAVSCAGIAPPAKVLGKKGPHSLDGFSKVLMVNAVGTFNVARLAAEAIAAGKADADNQRGCIVNTASIAAFEGQIGQCAYSASKGAVVAMMLPMARELASFGIRVNTVAPGVMHTPLMDTLPPKVQEELGAQVPNPKRLGRPEEFGALVEHILSNSYINGEVIRIDGALRMSA